MATPSLACRGIVTLASTLRRASRHDLNGEVQVNARERMVKVHLDLLLGQDLKVGHRVFLIEP